MTQHQRELAIAEALLAGHSTLFNTEGTEIHREN
jgi:hypothetical protein